MNIDLTYRTYRRTDSNIEKINTDSSDSLPKIFKAKVTTTQPKEIL